MAMTRRATWRTMSLMDAAVADLEQVMYEGDHHARQDPEPCEGSPWDRPDLPVKVLHLLRQAHEVLLEARAEARGSTTWQA